MADEARAMLDALMGGDRNAPIPQGTSHRNNKRKKNSSPTSDQMIMPGQKRRSCYDTNICPLYCAWGVDIYDLFTNTKSDLGSNEYIVDEEAREEFVGLPHHEKDRLGYEYMLFRKLQDLVRSCDRTVKRNEEKLRAEIARMQKQRGSGGSGSREDAVTFVQEEQLEACAFNVARLERLEEEIRGLVKELEEVEMEEKGVQAEIDKEKKEKEDEEKKENGKANGDKKEIESEEAKPTDEENKQDKPPHSPESAEPTTTTSEKQPNESTEKQNQQQQPDTTTISPEQQEKLSTLHTKKQTLLQTLEHKIQSTFPIRESIDSQRRQLYYIKSDTTSDKTVCDISGNFMSSRDADERIAAHYAGKQYVGWKMVREKLKSLVRKYGKGGPPPPPGPGRGPPMGGGGYPPYGGGGRGGPPPYGGGPPGYGYGYGPPPHGGGGGGYGGPQGYGGGGGGPPHWDRDWHGGGGGGGGGGGREGRDRGGRGRHDRSRSRERDSGSRSGGGSSSSRRRRSPSPSHWERDRYGGGGGGGGGGSRGYGNERRRSRWN